MYSWIAYLGLSGRKMLLTALEALEVASFSEDNNEWLPLPRTFTRPDLPVDNDNFTKQSQLRKCKYLENVMNQLTISDDFSVALLIGANCTKTLAPIEILQSRNGGPYTFKNWLGWYAVSPVNRIRRNKVSCNRIALSQAESKEVGTFLKLRRSWKRMTCQICCSKCIMMNSQNAII